MKYPVTLCLVLVNFSLAIAGRLETLPNRPRNGRIIGGHDASPQSHPYLVALQLRFLWARMRLCSGSILNDEWILTAGHCVKGSWLMNWLTMEAVVGTNNLEKKESTAQTVKISERIPHPNYGGDIGAYDIGLLKTAKKIQFNSAVAPIEMPASMGSLTHKSQNLILAGWGVLETTLFIPALPDILQEARVDYMPFEECNKAIDAIKEPYEDNPLDKDANICTGPITGGVAACSGDSGGPLIQYIPHNSPNDDQTTTETLQSTTEDDVDVETTWTANTGNEAEVTTETKEISSTTTETIATDDIIQNYKDQGFIPVIIGVVSWGISPCGEVGAPTVYSNVSTYSDFIFKHLYN